MQINLLDKYQQWYWQAHKKVLYMSWFSANTTKRKDNTPWNPNQTMGDSWHRYVHLMQ